jgi:DNA polymerase (family X)
MENSEFAQQISLYAQLLELEGEAYFKLLAYNNAVDAINALQKPIMKMADAEIRKIPAVGEAIYKKILDAKENGIFHQLQNKRQVIPIGVIDILKVPGLGVKKVRMLWQEHDITNTKQLLEACENDTVANIKGFGEKTQESIRQYLLFREENSDKIYFAHALPYIQKVESHLKNEFGEVEITLVGQMRRKMPVIDILQWVLNTENPNALTESMDNCDFLVKNIQKSGVFLWSGHFKSNLLKVEVRCASPKHYVSEVFLHSASEEHLFAILSVDSKQNLWQIAYNNAFLDEKTIYETAKMPFIPPTLRENRGEFELKEIPKMIEYSDLKGILHNHSTYSDGKHSLQQMADHTKTLGFAYFGISDHSKSAFYANGLNENRVLAQIAEVKKLNEGYAQTDFRVFMGIESDILTNGNLDYANDILQLFDYVVASIHTGFKMTEEQATQRLIKAIENPYTHILGHPTGRILLRREGYSVNMPKIIDACVANQVAIEINASPYRLDLDWTWIKLAVEKGAWLSINPDAHKIEDLENMIFGVNIAQKGLLTKSQTLNALHTSEVERFFKKEKISPINGL